MLSHPININGQLIQYSTHFKNIDVIFDSTFSFYTKLSHITKSLNYQLNSLRLIHHSITIPTATIIDSAYILPLFDYYNFILYNTPSSYIISSKSFRMLSLGTYSIYLNTPILIYLHT